MINHQDISPIFNVFNEILPRNWQVVFIPVSPRQGMAYCRKRGHPACCSGSYIYIWIVNIALRDIAVAISFMISGKTEKQDRTVPKARKEKRHGKYAYKTVYCGCLY